MASRKMYEKLNTGAKNSIMTMDDMALPDQL